ncbi:cytochrome c peroxidase [Methanolobus sediminis]|uniref:Cytochrome c peroxidase n=1 Tax=Methanolobus sediminis TaxID=3072978 RepID=A0AA51YLN4_9EURY|nr:cytochrome c peroxidase [Methanolobus sediminis]WMW24703.1 cytochrome c peroxidase [Methanolobus sediminis]
MNKRTLLIALALFLFTIAVHNALAEEQEFTKQEELGRLLYFDESLSTPEGQSCASCHDPGAGFADPDSYLPVSEGVLPNRFGNRNSPSAAYAAYSPEFYYDSEEELYIGGQFWDGRAPTLEEQAKGPFLNPLEMNNPNKEVVIVKINKSDYAGLFEEVTGVDLENLSEENVELAYNEMANAIAAFERTSELNQFSSKYDLFVAKEIKLDKIEREGLKLFNEKAMCAECHPSAPDDGLNPDHALFTDYTYDNLGTPKNPDNPFYDLPTSFNPDGEGFIDYGLGGFLKMAGYENWESENGKVKVPTLRNIAVTAPYMHNGVFENLTEVVNFYNTRDVADWPAPEVAENINQDELGDLGLTEEEIAAIVAFMETLTDGYDPESQE